jgi:hypothetical protein
MQNLPQKGGEREVVMETVCEFRNEAARMVLRGLGLAGAKVVQRARSPHGGDCSDRCFERDGSIRHCRCIRVMRVRFDSADWLLLFGNYREGPSFRLSGPYRQAVPLVYGGEWWTKVEV